MVVRDLFYNTPARLKFMKKDAAEGAAVFAVVQRVALSHPEVSREVPPGRASRSCSPPGTDSSSRAVYAVLGRELALGFTQVQAAPERTCPSTGFVSQPACCRGQPETGQFFFVNGRLGEVPHRCMAALEEAYQQPEDGGQVPRPASSTCTTRLSAVDVNVHPSQDRGEILQREKAL